MLCYKQLTMVEQTFRTAKSLLATRPIFHKVDETIRGHVSCSFLALVLKKELEERIADLGRKGSWPEILADLDSLTETKVEQDDKCFLLRSPPRPAASLALSAAGVALPPTVRQVDQALIATLSTQNVVPTPLCGADSRSRSISSLFALSKMSINVQQPGFTRQCPSATLQWWRCAGSPRAAYMAQSADTERHAIC
jgi:hypothetical protein